MMKALLIGHGKMGKLIEELAPEFGIQIHRIVTTDTPLILTGVDVAIDFSSPVGILKRIEALVSHKIPVIIGTTGWHEELEAAKKIVAIHQGAALFSANFSIGVTLFIKLVQEAAALFNQCDHYDIACSETHHRHKKDHPSGTARMIAETILEKVKRKEKICSHLETGAVQSNELQITSLRAGYYPGEHEVIFDGPDDTITLTHTARNRNDFARGALRAAHWIRGKQGFFTIEDLLT